MICLSKQKLFQKNHYVEMKSASLENESHFYVSEKLFCAVTYTSSHFLLNSPL